MKCDLHIHSLFSDGTLSPSDIISAAKHAELAVALTDHNTVLGCEEFLLEAEKQGVTAIAGTELSTVYGEKELHLLGLFISPEYFQQVEALTVRFHALKEASNIDLVTRLNKAGYCIDYSNIKRRNPLGYASRAHVAAELMDKGYVKSVAEAFETVLSKSYGYYIPPKRLSFLDAVRFLREIKAVPIIAHPLQDLDEVELRALLPEAIDAGLLGMEVLHSSYSDSQKKLAHIIAKDFGLLESGGSDFHGKNKPDVLLGSGKGDLNIPYEFFEKLSKVRASL